MKIFLVGLPGSGKSTLGKQLAFELKLPFVDLDAEIEKSLETSVKEIFKKHGEDLFRKKESAMLHHFCDTATDFVMATGGGVPVFFDNMAFMNQQGHTIFLDVPPREIAKRVLKTQVEDRPLLKAKHPDELKDQIEFLRSQRIPFYQQAHTCLKGEAIQLSDLVISIERKF
jgi:shikimate kinase